MANLRDLIGYADRDEVIRAATGLTTDTSTPPNYPGSAYKQLKYRGNHCTGAYTCFYECMVWKPPAGTTFVKFEMWGGGGGGPGVCCCMWGTPGGSGSYAYKCICTGYDLGGCTYEICVAGNACCSPINVGYRGCKTYITGYELDNFCAEGGGPGHSHCALAAQLELCNYDERCAEGMKLGSCQWCNGPYDSTIPWSCSQNIGGPLGHGSRDCFQKDTKSGVYDLIGIGNTFGSCGKQVNYGHPLDLCYGAVCHNCYYCAPFFGADGGAHGLPGGLGNPCHVGLEFQPCIMLEYMPYPGGLINTRGGWVPRRHESQNQAGGNGTTYWVNEFFGYSGSTREHGIPGMGGITASACAGNCYCGGPGNSGQVIITYG